MAVDLSLKFFIITVKDIQIFKGTIILQKCCLKMKIGKKHGYTTAVLGNLSSRSGRPTFSTESFYWETTHKIVSQLVLGSIINRLDNTNYSIL